MQLFTMELHNKERPLKWVPFKYHITICYKNILDDHSVTYEEHQNTHIILK